MSDFHLAPGPKRVLGPEVNPWWWSPSNVSAVFGPDDFRKRLKDIGHELEVTWSPIAERWLIFCRAPRVNHKICQGWRLLFINQEADGSFLPLDERVFARIYAASTYSHGSAVKYFDRVVEEMRRDKEAREAKDSADQIDMAMPWFDHAQIQVSGFGKSSGSKFSTYHSGI